MCWIVGFENRRFTRQVEVPQPRQPEAQRACAQHGGQRLTLGQAQRAHGVVGTKEALRTLIARRAR